MNCVVEYNSICECRLEVEAKKHGRLESFSCINCCPLESFFRVEMRDQMSDILASIEVLSEVDTDGIEPTGHSVDVHSVMREDISSDSITLEDALANAPRQEDGFIRVRAVLEE